MSDKELLYRRIHNQLLGNKTGSPEWVVQKMLAIQGQEYAVSKYAIGLRSRELTNLAVEKAINEGKIIRTHLLRPTWHLVHANDLQWLLAYSKPRVSQLNGFMYRKMELTTKVFTASNKIIEHALTGNKHLTRDEIATQLRLKKIGGDGVRMSIIMMQAELEGLVCSGPKKGKQFTYALVGERVSPTKQFSEQELLSKLAKRYFESRGPATLEDLCTWSSMKKTDAKKALLDCGELKQATKDNKLYYYFDGPCPEPSSIALNFLMPDYDEFGMAYKDRSFIFNPESLDKYKKSGQPLFYRMIVLNGKISGTWQKQGESPKVEVFPFSNLKANDNKNLDVALKHYARFFS